MVILLSYCKFSCDCIKSNMNCVFKIGGVRYVGLVRAVIVLPLGHFDF